MAKSNGVFKRLWRDPATRGKMKETARRASEEGLTMQEGLTYDPAWKGTRKPETWTPEMRAKAAESARMGWEIGSHDARISRAKSADQARARARAEEAGRKRLARERDAQLKEAMHQQALRIPGAPDEASAMKVKRAGRRVVCIGTGAVYQSVSEAARMTGIQRS